MKERLDKYLTDLGYFETKSKASSAIMAGNVKINDEYITKAGFQINPEKEYDIVVKSMPFVSRGGFKLKKALETFPVKVDGRICFDAGASTGGFTDCLLQNGAKFVYAVDVGYGQLDWKIRSDNRVKTIEKTNLMCNTLFINFSNINLHFLITPYSIVPQWLLQSQGMFYFLKFFFHQPSLLLLKHLNTILVIVYHFLILHIPLYQPYLLVLVEINFSTTNK